MLPRRLLVRGIERGGMRIIAFVVVYLGSAMIAIGTIAWGLMHLEAIVPVLVGGIVVIVLVRRATAASRERRKAADDAALTPNAEPVTWSGGTLT
jgi:Flp pilus assembly protein TadB